MKEKMLLVGSSLFFASQGALTLYSLTTSFLAHLLIFVGYSLCVRFLFLDILFPQAKRG